MNRRPTRRTIGKLLIASPVALSGAALACVSSTPPPVETRGPSSPEAPRLTPKEKKDLEKAVSRIRKSLAVLQKVSVPLGAEPAFLFAPLLPPASPAPSSPPPSRRRKK